MSACRQRDEALLALLSHLASQDYDFVTPTPETHRRVIDRAGGRMAENLRDAFGWSLPFTPALLPAALFGDLARAKLVEAEDGVFKSAVRVSRLDGRLFLHSAFPTTQGDAVFFGPDSYRFVDFLRTELVRVPGTSRLVDIGTGAGVGAIMAAPLLPGARLTLTDINPLALGLARINARHAGLEVELVEGSGLDAVRGPFDLAIANPPYIVDAGNRAYRDGGGMHGAGLSLAWALAAARAVAPGGRVLLYTGSAIVAGRDGLRAALERELPSLGVALRYREIDPDVFGEELVKPSYEDVERIAVVGAVIQR